MVETRAYYCSVCGKRISKEDADAGGMTERDGQVLCSGCAQDADQKPDRIDNVEKHETFVERFNRKYREKAEKTRKEYVERNRLFDQYKKHVTDLFDLIERKASGTPIRSNREYVAVERKISIFEATTEHLEKLTLTLENFRLHFVPEGINYQTGAASLRIEHNNPREQPQTIYLHLRVVNKTEENPLGDLAWMVKIGFRNFSVFSELILERLLESVFLS